MTNQLSVFFFFFFKQKTAYDMVVMPPAQVGDLLVTDGTETVLRLPQSEEPLSPPEIGFHLHAEACFEVHLPRGIIGIGGRFDLGVALNWHRGGFVEILLLSLAVCVD